MENSKANNSTSNWENFKFWHYHDTESGFSLDISRMKVDLVGFEKLETRLKAALSHMKDLDSGSIANPDEGRMVGHYWLRNADLAPSDEIRNEIIETKKSIKDFVSAIHSGSIASKSGERFHSFIVVGIGGSALGPQLLEAALTPACSKLKAYFFDNTDPDGMNTVLESIPDLSRTLVIVISKSGGTQETYNGQIVAKEYFRAKGVDPADCFVAVTQAGSALDKTAQSENWLKRFPMWDWVGGRTSLWSAVGLLPAALLGIDIDKLLLGASKMDELNRCSEPKKNPACLLAFAAYLAGKGVGTKNMVVLPYKDRLALFSKYLQQLIMESLGKEKDLDGNTVNQGIAVYGNKGSTDQHSYIQQLRDGVNNFYAVFIEVLKDRTVYELNDVGPANPSEIEVASNTKVGDYLSGFYQGTRLALTGNDRENLSLTISEVNAENLGLLLALFERFVGIYAHLVNVNAYHQPGVEAGKKAASVVVEAQKNILEVLAKTTQVSLSEIVEKIPGLDSETAFIILRHLVANKRVYIKSGETLFESEYSLV